MQAEVKSAEGSAALTRPASAEPRELHHGTCLTHAAGPGRCDLGRYLHRDARGDRVGHSPSARVHLPERPEGERGTRDDFKDSQRDECDHREGWAVESVSECRDADEQRANRGERRQDGQDRRRRTCTTNTGESGNTKAVVRSLDLGDPRRESVEGEEHIEVRHVVEKLVGERTAQGSDRPLGPPGDGGVHESRRTERKQERQRKDDTSRGKYDAYHHHAQHGGHQCHRQGLNDAQRQILQFVNIADQPGEQVPSAGASQSVRSPRHQSPVNSDPQCRELAKGRVVAGEALQVAS